MSRENIFLTDTRRTVLENPDELDYKEESLRVEKSRIKSRSRDAVDELIEVAQSPHIDNTAWVNPEKLATLLHALFIPDFGHIEGGGLATDPRRTDVDDTIPTADYTDKYEDFQRRVYVAADSPLHDYREEQFDRTQLFGE